MSKVFKTKKFIEKVRKIHGDKYDYSLVDYINAKTKVKIICKIHGIFEQKPDAHINQKQGCPKCAGVKKLTQKEFIEKAKLIHGNTYNYSLVKYKNSTTKICIICPIHGEFKQEPNKHLQKQGCPKCAGNIKLTIEDFIQRAKLIHGNTYNYSLVKYKNKHTNIIIICPEHGEFEQRPNNHLYGQGCPVCGEIKKLHYLNNINGQYHLKYPKKYNSDSNSIIYRSSYELKAFQMIEEDNNIISWESETVKIPYELDGIERNYIVDLKIKTKNKKIKLIEIKPEIQTKKPLIESTYHNIDVWCKNQAKWNAAKAFCDERGWKFEIWTEKELNI